MLKNVDKAFFFSAFDLPISAVIMICFLLITKELIASNCLSAMSLVSKR